MTKFKKLMAVAAVSMLGIQLMGAGTAFANPANVDSECDFGSDSLEVTLGYDNGTPDQSASNDAGDAGIWVGSDGMLYCETSDSSDSDNPYSQAASSVDSITVEMDDDDSNGNLTIYLDDDDANASDWPGFDTFDINVTTRLIVDGSYVDEGAANKLRVTVGKSTFSFLGTSGTYVASGLQFADGGDDDAFDASKATVRVYADGTGEGTHAGKGDDVYKGGSNNDKFELSGYADDLVVYGNGGNDLIQTGSGDDQGWGGDGADTIDLLSDNGTATSVDIAAPGAGDDDVDNADVVTYADLSGGMTWSNGATTDISTGGAAGDDEFDSDLPFILEGTSGDDVISDSDALAEVYGLGGDDVIRVGVDAAYVEGGAGNDLIIDKGTTPDSDNEFYGNAGNDVLRGKAGDDTLKGGPGSDQSWGGTGEDTCGGEVTNRCELFARR